MSSRRRYGQRGTFQQGTPISPAHPLIKVRKRIQVQRSGEGGRELSCRVNQEGLRPEQNTSKSRETSCPRAHPQSGKTVDAEGQKKNGRKLHHHVSEVQSKERGDHRYPLLRQRRISCLRKSGVPLGVPGVEPVVRVMRREKDMKICVVGLQQQ